MTVLILEDEPLAAGRLTRLLAEAAPTARVLAVLDTVAGALAWLAAHPAPDLVLSDVQLADGLSFDVFARAVVTAPVIFTTAYDQYALRAFETHSVAYLLKPVKLAGLAAALEKLRQWRGDLVSGELVGTTPGLLPAASLTSSPFHQLTIERLLDALPRPARAYKERFLVRQGEAWLPLPAREVAWFQSRHDTTTLAAPDGRRFVVEYTLEELEGLLDPAAFLRLNRQMLAAVGAVRRLVPALGGRLAVELTPAPTGEVLVSKERASAVRRWLEG